MSGTLKARQTGYPLRPSAENGQLRDGLLGQPSLCLCGSYLVMSGVTAFVPLIEGGTTHVPVMIIRLILMAAFTVWMLRRLQYGSLSIYATKLSLLVGAFIGLALLSLLWSSYINVSLQWLVTLLTYAGFFFLVLHGTKSIRHVRALVILLLGMGLFEGGLGIVQYVWLGEVRAKGTFFNPNFFATYEIVTFMLALGLLLFMERFDLGWREKLFLGCAATTAFFAFVVAQSRGATLAFLVAVTFVGLCRFGKASLIFLLVLVVGGIVLPNPIKQRVLEVSAHDPYAYTRVEIWVNSLHRIADHPWGMGMGMYKYSSFEYRFPIEDSIVQYGKRAESAHNEYLQMTVELGLGGLALFLFGIGAWGWEAKEVMDRELPQLERGGIVGLCAGVLAILVHAVMDSVFHEPALVLLLILCGSLVLALKRLDTPDRIPTWNLPFPYHPVRAALALLMVASFAVLIIQPAAAWFAYEQGNNYSQKSQYAHAMEWYRRATLIDPGTTAYRDAVALMEVGRFRESGDSDWLIQAVEDIKVCMALNALDGRFPSRLGAAYLLLAGRAVPGEKRDGLTDLAAVSYRDAIKLDPFSPFNYLELGKIRWQQGYIEEAKALLAQAAQNEPNFLPAKLALAKLAMEMGQTDFARSQYAMVREIRERYQGRTLTPLEKEYVHVDLASLDRATR